MDPADLFRRQHLAVFRYLLRWTGERAAAEELMQETFVRVVRHAAEYDDRDRERAWLFGIARNLAANWSRGRARRPTEVLREPASHDDDGAGLLLAGLLASLSEPDRELLLLREVGGLDYAELAEVTGTTVPAVRSRLCRVRAAARDWLRAERLGAALKEVR